MRIAILGGGISGIAASSVLLRFGHEVTLFERAPHIGGVWATAYPEVHLQNVAEHYRLADFPWPFEPDLHPTAGQIRRYLDAAVSHHGIDVRLQHEVIAARDDEEGWSVEVRSPSGTETSRFDFVVVASGHYGQPKHYLPLAGRERFAGSVLTERDIHDLDALAGKKIAVVGFGKSALDIAALAAERGARVHHVFRAPRWLLPRVMFGVHSANIIFSRLSTRMLPAWEHPSGGERWLHEHASPVVATFWSLVGLAARAELGIHSLWRDPEVRRRMTSYLPAASVTFHMRAATALAPDTFFSSVAAGRIEPWLGQVAGLDERGLVLEDGRQIPCELVVLAVGNEAPRFPFLPQRYRDLLEGEPDGPQLYRHILHPRVPRLAFAGYNHGFMHVPGVEVATIWLASLLRGDLVLPPVEEMERCIEQIRAWKRGNTLFEPARSCGVNTRFHQYIDVLMGDLGLNPLRKSNALAELASAYTAADYGGLIAEYEASRAGATGPRRPLPLLA